MRDPMPRQGEPLTVGEVELLAMVARGLTYDAIARRIGSTEDAVRWSTRRIRAKLGAPDRASAVDQGWRRGYLGVWARGEKHEIA